MCFSATNPFAQPTRSKQLKTIQRPIFADIYMLHAATLMGIWETATDHLHNFTSVFSKTSNKDIPTNLRSQLLLSSKNPKLNGF